MLEFKQTLQRIHGLAPEYISDLLEGSYLTLHPHRSYLEEVREQAVAEEVNREYYNRFIKNEPEKDAEDIRLNAKRRLFDSLSEFEQYEDEFESGPIHDIVGDALEETEGNWFFDSHTKTSKMYYSLIRKYKPDTVVETGVHNGINTLTILVSLSKNNRGNLYSIDDPAAHSFHDSGKYEGEFDEIIKSSTPYSRSRPSAAMSGSENIPNGHDPGWIIPEEYRENWEFLSGKSQELLPGLLNRVGPVEFFFHDSQTTITAMGYELELAWYNLIQNGFICSHHIGWNRAFNTFSANHNCESGLLCAHSRDNEDSRPIPSTTGYIRKV
jgi:hypothetical protein